MKNKIWVLCAVLSLVGCSKCSKKPEALKEPTIESVMPKDAVGAVIVQNVGDFGQKLLRLQDLKVVAFLAQLQGYDSGQGFTNDLVTQLGVDIRSTVAIEKAGLDANRQAASIALSNGQVLLVLPIKDEKQFHTVLESLSYKRFGAGATGEKTENGIVLHTLSPQANTPPKLAYVIKNKFAILGIEEGIAKLVPMAALKENQTLQSDAQFTTQLASLSGAKDVLVWLPNGSPLLSKAKMKSAVASVSLTEAGVDVKLNAVSADEQLSAILVPGKGTDVSGNLPSDAFVVMRFLGDLTKAGPQVNQILGPYLSRALAEGKFDLKTEVLDRIEPGAMAALSLADKPPLGRGMPELNLKQTNPFTFVHLSGVAKNSVPAESMVTLEKVVAIAPKFGAQMKKETRQNHDVILTNYAQGEGVHFGIKDTLVVFGSPLQRLDALLTSDGKTPQTALQNQAFAAHIDLTKLSQSVRNLPESAWGLGGFAVKATTVRWLDATDDLKSVSLGISGKGTSIDASATLELVLPKKGAVQ
jgi:hypothetical protein